MGRYWDIAEDKRADLTRDEVAECCEYQLMEEGLTIPPEPAPPPVKPDVKVPTVTIWMVGRAEKYGNGVKPVLGCMNRDDAERIAATPLVEIDTDYRIPSEFRFAKPLPAIAMEPVEAFDFAGIEAVRSTLVEYQSAVKQYETAVRERNDAQKAATTAVADIWDDWHERLHQRHLESVLVERFNKYRTLCRESPDPSVPAWRFLIMTELTDVCQRALERAGVVFVDGVPAGVPLSL